MSSFQGGEKATEGRYLIQGVTVAWGLLQITAAWTLDLTRHSQDTILLTGLFPWYNAMLANCLFLRQGLLQTKTALNTHCSKG